MEIFFLSGKIKIKKKQSKITKFVINLPKIIEKAKKFQEIILIMIEIGT